MKGHGQRDAPVLMPPLRPREAQEDSPAQQLDVGSGVEMLISYEGQALRSTMPACPGLPSGEGTTTERIRTERPPQGWSWGHSADLSIQLTDVVRKQGDKETSDREPGV